MEQFGARGFRLSQEQNQLWSEQGENAPYSQVALLLKGKVDESRLRLAVEGLVKRHEILRTTFTRSPGMKAPFQVVNDASGLAVDLQSRLAVTRKRGVPEQLPTLEVELTRSADAEHWLKFTVPALCADFASLKRIAFELAGFYAGEAQADEPLQYADYAAWQAELRETASPEADEAQAYWNTRLSSASDCPLLPFAGRPQLADPAGNTVPIALDSRAIDWLSADAERAADILLAAWQALLWRFTGQNQITVGRVSDGRSVPELEQAIGLFSKVSPETVDFAANPAFGDVVEANRRSRQEARGFEAYFPGGTKPLSIGFQAVLEAPPLPSGSLHFSLDDAACDVHSFALELRATLEPNGWQARLQYDPREFARSTVERLSRSFTALLASAAATGNAPCGSLAVLDAAARDELLTGFNRTAAERPLSRTIPELFAEQAERHPDRPALRSGSEVIAYGELNDRANRLAELLRAKGAGPNVPVGLLMERSAEMIVGVLAILKAGACYLPLVSDNPPARIVYQLTASQAPLVLTQQKLAYLAAGFNGTVMAIDAQPAAAPPLQAGPQATPSDLAYVLYTSGSTGTPKGVAVPHAALVNYSHFICELLGAYDGTGLQFATVSTLAADLGNTAVFPALISGGCLHVIDYETAIDPHRFAQYQAAHPIDVLKITPSHLDTLLTAGGASVLPRKTLFLGGEAFSWALLERIRAHGNCQVFNHYGPTEATVGCCTFDTAQQTSDKSLAATVPIGRPIANAQTYIFDSQLQPVPIGVAGELCVGGQGVASGYLGQPEQTRERFLDHSQGRLYRTGDLARFLPDGTIEFLGRLDQQIKIRGFRVELAEIQIALERHPAVRQALVLASGEGAEKRILAYVTPRANESPQRSASELRSFLQSELPEYMVPAAILAVPVFPLTGNGKVDWRALPSPDAAAGRAPQFVAPRTPDEQTLANIWCEVLRVERVSVTANFFDLGGHSLLATQIISRVRNQFRVDLPLRTFLQTPTIGELALNILACPPIETEEEEMARLLDQIEGLSEEEARELLAGMDTGKT